MIVSVLQLPVRSGCEDDVVRFYVDRNVFELASQVGGFRRGSLLAPTGAGGPFLVVAEWDDLDAYQRWLEAPAREQLSGQLSPLLDGDHRTSTYSVAITTTLGATT